MRRFALLFFALVISIASSPANREPRPPAQSEVEAAAAAFAAGDWSAAHRAYSQIVDAEPANGLAWLRLGIAAHELGHHAEALEAFDEVARQAGGSALGARALYHRARALAAGGDAAAAITALETLAALGVNATAARAIEAAAEFDAIRDRAAFAAVLRSLVPCSSDEHRLFDFWLGSWDVYSGGQLAGTNEISLELGGCALRERWTSAGGVAGHSYNFYDAARGLWHQTWIDASGNALYLDGGWEEGRMVLRDATNRVTWTPLDGGRVRQHWESTTDGGATWSTAFDGEYRPRDGVDRR